MRLICQDMQKELQNKCQKIEKTTFELENKSQLIKQEVNDLNQAVFMRRPGVAAKTVNPKNSIFFEFMAEATELKVVQQDIKSKLESQLD